MTNEAIHGVEAQACMHCDIYVSTAHRYHVPAAGLYLRPGFSSLSR
jgi:hypothetical protein